ncbi:phospholipase B1, membrane-associated [Polypterus senegalus]|uniref:phospholipase B1, membrane-associated n=1 Tax=Polypterus senegalus TaxID=55291 RepID=UPI00196545F0|nr:phospholipase B1, membrane-associated [Polypterus senegalus]
MKMASLQTLAPLLALLSHLCVLQGSPIDHPILTRPVGAKAPITEFLCNLTAHTGPLPSSVHSLRPADVSVVAAMGLVLSTDHSRTPRYRAHRSGLLDALTEILQMFNPGVSRLPQLNVDTSSLAQQAKELVSQLKDHQGAEGFKQDWKVVVIFVGLAGSEAQIPLEDAKEQVDEALGVLRDQVPRALVKLVLEQSECPDGTHGEWQRCSDNSDSDRRSTAQQLSRAVLSWSYQTDLQRHLQEWSDFSQREDFAVVLQDVRGQVGRHLLTNTIQSEPILEDGTPVSSILQLWNDMLQEARDWHEDEVGLLRCPSQDRPFLRTGRNSEMSSSTTVPPTDQTGSASPAPSRGTTAAPIHPVHGSRLSCEDRNPSSVAPQSVHALRPADVKVVAAIGDSLTAGNGIGSKPSNVVDVLKQYRGLSWSIGGDKSLETVTTLPSKSLAQVRAVGLGGLGGFLGHFIISRQRGLTDILRKFNPQLTGFSTGTGDASKPGAAFNQAVPGSTAKDLLQQVQKLVTIMKEDKKVNFTQDWKIITVFVGGNDLCDHCHDTIPHSAKNFARQVQAALDILHSEVPRVFVNLVDVLHVIPLRTFHQDSSLKCPTRLVKILCPCVVKPRENSTELHGLATLNRAYQEALRALVSSGRYDTSDDFTVVLQPFFRDVPTPLTEDGRPDRSFFSADCFHLSQKSHSQMARALWNNMLQPVGHKSELKNLSESVPLSCPSQDEPFLRTYKNSNASYPEPEATQPPNKDWGSDLICPDMLPSENVPTSAHKLRPADVKVVAALGDSLTAGFGIRAQNLAQLNKEWRGLSWSIGGDDALDKVTTLPNILRRFNSKLVGFSLGTGKEQSHLNMAVSGAKAADVPAQARHLVQRLQESPVNFQEDWKLVTLFIGGNDLCQYCLDRETLSWQNYVGHIQETLDILYSEVPRVFVTLVEILEIEGLRRIKGSGLGCTLLQRSSAHYIHQGSMGVLANVHIHVNLLKDNGKEPKRLRVQGHRTRDAQDAQGQDSLELMEARMLNRYYQVELEKMVYSGRYDGREDFAVVTQPFFRSSFIPLADDGTPDVRFFSSDCFHFSERGHAMMAISLWNNMVLVGQGVRELEPVGQKTAFNNFTYERRRLKCPSQVKPYFFTKRNSFPLPPVQPAAPSNGIPSWTVVVAPSGECCQPTPRRLTVVTSAGGPRITSCVAFSEGSPRRTTSRNNGMNFTASFKERKKERNVPAGRGEHRPLWAFWDIKATGRTETHGVRSEHLGRCRPLDGSTKWRCLHDVLRP